MAKQPKDNSESTDTSKNLLGALLQGYKEDHYNLTEPLLTSVSSGSLILDQYVKFTQGVHRLTGYSQSGKTSEALLVGKNLIEKYKDIDGGCKGLYIKAEGRISENIQKRSGMKFTANADEWDNGSVFIYHGNIFESICAIIESLIKHCYEKKTRLFIIIDSVDGLRLKSDIGNDIGKEKVAGPQLIMKRFLTRVALPIDRYGVVCFAISQVSSSIKIDPYSKEIPRMTSGSGGWALAHSANIILDFEHRNNSDYILQKPKDKPDPVDNKIIGHWTTVRVVKSDDEKENIKVKYPIKHGRVGGSVWTEYEIIDLLYTFDVLKKKGAWYAFEDGFRKELEGVGFKTEEQYHGEAEVFALLENNAALTKYLYDKFSKMLMS